MSTSPTGNPDRDPAAGTADAEPDEDDTEGHSLLNAQFGQQIAASHARDAAEWARGEKARREAEKARKDRKGR